MASLAEINTDTLSTEATVKRLRMSGKAYWVQHNFSETYKKQKEKKTEKQKKKQNKVKPKSQELNEEGKQKGAQGEGHGHRHTLDMQSLPVSGKGRGHWTCVARA